MLNIKRFVAGSIWNPYDGEESVSHEIKSATQISNDYIRKAMIQKIIVQHEDPRTALTAIQQIAKSTTHQNLDYCHVVRELQYKMRLKPNHAFQKSTNYNDSDETMKNSKTDWESKHLRTFSPGTNTDLASHSRLRSAAEDCDVTSTSTGSSAGTKESYPTSYLGQISDIITRVDTADTATRIWRSMERSGSQSFEEALVIGRRSFSLPHDQETLRNVRETEFSPWVV